ncbi:SDR family oxidoreductase [Tolypothrix sp. PCC 7910]|uniref:SDR family NAD(P)-dependent oxidoreductase n=1 Tax=Tolypothrix sp. PCC 7910 TaxID=2099387 RepID=UPI001427897F|nr:SDR family oxidoreductase [Tolypothrix sp. PCC 7910]QIR38668.1 SDR family oxidoreductase [Tolypothrix sp. PCC 7910]
MQIPQQEWQICLQVLQQISEDSALINSDERFHSLIAKIYKNSRKEVRRAIRQSQEAEDKQLKAMTVMLKNQIQHQPAAALSNAAVSAKLKKSATCYVCKKAYFDLHFFYHMLCPSCAELNYDKRNQSTDLTGRVALITGGRIKIGYQVALRMLHDGARVILTTRFPHDTVRRFSAEPDFSQWRSQLEIYGLDLRYIPAVEAFARHLLDTESALDIIINNAAQTIKRPLAFYQHLLAEEENPREILAEQAQGLIKYNAVGSPLLETQPYYKDYLANSSEYFPANTFDADGEQVDLRPINSWVLKLNEISTVEMLEVQLVNAIAPFILNSQLKPLLMRSPFERRFIINVSAMEGQFNRKDKTVYHPHTNMAKAALNMMTRTSAADYARDRIFMNSVDTGWITNENPHPKKTHLQQTRGFHTPLDVIDGMARIYDPIVQGIENSAEPLYGHFLKDYAPYPW